MKELKQPIDVPWNQTYCIFSLYLIRIVQFLVLAEILIKAIFLFAIFCPDDYFNKVFFQGPFDLGKACEDSDVYNVQPYTDFGL